jgi:pimeloyl-ACP methyl ester carboxylesterase
MGHTVTGRFALPKRDVTDLNGVVLMLRGHQNAQGYYTGKGTEYPARYYLRRGYAVVAPDFIGYAGSDSTPAPTDAHQFYSTINAVELYMSLENLQVSFTPGVPASSRAPLPASFRKIVMWGHSNGGQVAIQTL